MTTADTIISEVVIYRDGARVTRTGELRLPVGAQKVTIEGITDRARKDSFRVKGKGPAVLSSIDVQTETTVFEPKEDTKKLHDELKKLEKKALELQDEIALQQSRMAQSEAIRRQFSEHFGMVFAANEGSLESLVEMDKQSSKMSEDIRATIRRLNEEALEVRNKMNVIRNNIGEIEADRRTERSYSLEVSLEVKKEANVALEISYQTSSASWRPSYDVDLYPGKATLRRIAQLRNRTGEDWSKVKLTVSTATAKPAEAIEATPYYISAYDPEQQMKNLRRMAATSRSEMEKESRPEPSAVPGAVGAMPPPAPVEIEEEFAEASETVSGIAIYEVPKKMTIKSDDEEHPVTLIEEDLDSKSVHHWYPDGMAEVIAQDIVTNGNNVILPGAVKVFAEADYIGETSFDMVSPREEFKIGTRIANDVKGEKKLVEREVEEAGVLRGKLRRSYKYRLEVSNYSKKPIAINIYDRVPHSLNPAIEVKADWDKIAMNNMELGVLEWKRTIEPNAKDTIEYAYEVQWEKNVTISPALP